MFLAGWGKVIVDDGVLPKGVVMISACACEVKIYMCLRLQEAYERRECVEGRPLSRLVECVQRIGKEKFKSLLLYSSKELAEQKKRTTKKVGAHRC
jgi:hypothetical protein